MAETKKIMTPEEKRQHLHDIITNSQKYKEEAQAKFERKCETHEYKEIFKHLKEENARRGIVVSGE